MRRWMALSIAGFALAAAPSLPTDVVSFLRDHAACHPKDRPPAELIALLKTDSCTALVQRRNALLERYRDNQEAVCTLKNAAGFVGNETYSACQISDTSGAIVTFCDPMRVYFETGSSELTGNSSQIVRLFVIESKRLLVSRIGVLGFSEETEELLVAQRRAEVVKTELVALGIDADTISTASQNSNYRGRRVEM
jgi:outer membrane protein OmpA-like peptidoglycan-associated protein